jgi:hypothetical protein
MSGCSSLTSKKGVIDNVFYSTKPKIIIKVTSEFQLIDNLSMDKTGGERIDGDAVTANFSLDDYRFAVIDDHKIKKFLFIRVGYAQTSWIKYFPKKLKDDSLQYGSEEYQALKMNYLTFVGKFSTKKWFSMQVVEKDYEMPCGMFKYTKGTLGSDKYLLAFIYFEDMSDSNFSCADWRNKHNLSTEQNEYVLGFYERMRYSFEIMDYDSNIENILNQ